MTPAARSYWWALFVEDTRPRIKEIRYSLYLVRRSPLVVAGIIILIGYVLIAIFVPYFAPYGPEERIWTETLQPPGPNHIWGTDPNGGDVFSMVMWATQIDLKIAVSVVAVALAIGTLIGVAAGYFGGAVDEIVMRITDVFFAFPGLILAMAIVSALGERNLDNISVALMIVWWPTYSRLVRGQVLIEREKLYVEAARSVGASDLRIMMTHILPNTIQPVIVQATLDMGGVLLTAAGLSFIGYGAEAGTAEWGLMISTGQDHFTLFWMIFYPGMAMLLCALAFNLVGDGVRDIMDPKLRRR
ncbi:MAG: ABC transporter permease [Candidatus Thorarchaeota archaeon]|nr:MAG: ABC transporter permease [Candidatus Thorarchaeota archaeon]